jgi:maltose O-acetyltransferase
MLKYIYKIIRHVTWKYSEKKVRCLLKNRTISVFGSPDILFENNIEIGNNCSLNHQVYLNGMGGIKIGNNVTISVGSKIISTGLDIDSSIKKHINKKIVIEDNVWIGANATVLSGIIIKKNSIVAAGSLVNKDIGESEIWAGIPARLIKKRS